MMTLAVIVVCVLLGVAAAVFRARRAGRAAISEAELDRRLARLRRSERMPTDEERRRRAANLQAILDGEPLVRAPRPKDQQVSTRPSPWWELVCILFSPAARAHTVSVEMGLGLLMLVTGGIHYLVDDSSEAARFSTMLLAVLSVLAGSVTTRGVYRLCKRTEGLHSRRLRRPAEIDETAERGRHPHRH